MNFAVEFTHKASWDDGSCEWRFHENMFGNGIGEGFSMVACAAAIVFTITGMILAYVHGHGNSSLYTAHMLLIAYYTASLAFAITFEHGWLTLMSITAIYLYGKFASLTFRSLMSSETTQPIRAFITTVFEIGMVTLVAIGITPDTYRIIMGSFAAIMVCGFLYRLGTLGRAFMNTRKTFQNLIWLFLLGAVPAAAFYMLAYYGCNYMSVKDMMPLSLYIVFSAFTANAYLLFVAVDHIPKRDGVSADASKMQSWGSDGWVWCCCQSMYPMCEPTLADGLAPIDEESARAMLKRGVAGGFTAL